MKRLKINFFGYTPVEDPLPGLNFLLTLAHLLGSVAFFVYAFVDGSCDEVTVYQVNQPLSACTSMLATFSCRTSNFDAATSSGHELTLNSRNCLSEQTVPVYGLHHHDRCTEFVENSFDCQTTDYVAGSQGSSQLSMSPANCATDFTSAASDPNYVCEGTVLEPVELSLCDGFAKVCISTPLSVKLSQALAYSTSLMGLLALIYNYKCKSESQKNDAAQQREIEPS